MAQAKSLTQQDIDTVLRYITTRDYPTRNRLMFLFTVLVGLRVSEFTFEAAKKGYGDRVIPAASPPTHAWA